MLRSWLNDWTMEPPRDRQTRVNRPQALPELEVLRVGVQRGSWFRAGRCLFNPAISKRVAASSPA